jgi:hypothetical protein
LLTLGRQAANHGHEIEEFQGRAVRVHDFNNLAGAILLPQDIFHPLLHAPCVRVRFRAELLELGLRANGVPYPLVRFNHVCIRAQVVSGAVRLLAQAQTRAPTAPA